MIEKLQTHPFMKHRDFRLLFLARLISAIGDKFFLLALVWFMLKMDHPLSSVYAALVSAVYLLPTVLFGPLMGTIVDRINRKTCLLFSDFMRTILMTILAYYLWHGNSNIYFILVFVFIIATFNPLFDSGTCASIPALTDEETLAEATALDSSVLFISQLLGALLGSMAIVFVGVQITFFLNALTFLVSFLLVVGIGIKLEPEQKDSTTSYMDELKEGFRFVYKRRPLFALTLFFGLFNFFIAALPYLIIVIVEKVLGGSYWLICLEGFFGLGSVIVVMLLSFYNKSSKYFYRYLFIATLMMSIGFTFLGLTNNGWVHSLLLFISGGALAYINGTAVGLFQRIVPEAVKGRFFAILSTLCYAMIPLSTFINGLLVNEYHVSKVLVIEGSLAIIVAFVIIVLPRVQEIEIESEPEPTIIIDTSKINIGGDLS